MRYFSKFRAQNLQSDTYSSRVVNFDLKHGELLNIKPKVIFDKHGMKYAFQEKDAFTIIHYLNALGEGKMTYQLMIQDAKPHFRKARV